MSLFEPFCPASSFVTVDKDVARIPPHAILPNVNDNHKKLTMRKIYLGFVILLFLQFSSFGQISDLGELFKNNLKQLDHNTLIDANFLEKAKGKTVVLTSLAKGCKWRLEEMAYYNKLKSEYPNDFEVFITFTDDLSTMSKYAQDVNFDFVYIYDPMMTISKKLFPSDSISSVLFDSKGFIQEKTSSSKLNRDKILIQLNKNQSNPELNKSSSFPIINFNLKRYELGDKVLSNLSSVNLPTKILTGYKVNESIDTIENIKFCTLTGENILGLYSYAYNLPKNRFIYDKEIDYIDSHSPNQRYTLTLSVSNLHADFNKMLIKQIDLNFGLETAPIEKNTKTLVLSQIDLAKGRINIANTTDNNNIISETEFHLKANNIKVTELARLIEEKLKVPVELNINPNSNYSVDISIENSDCTIDSWIKLFSENGLILNKKMIDLQYIKIENGSR